MPTLRDLETYCPWMTKALALIGTREIPGPRHNPVILRWWESIKAPFRDDETPYCSAYVGHCLEAVGILSTRSAAARSWVRWGVEVPGPFHRAYGSVLVLKRPGASSWSGHVGFLTGYDPDAEVFQVLGANQDNQVKFSEYPASRFLALRQPPYIANVWAPGPMISCPRFTARGATTRSDA